MSQIVEETYTFPRTKKSWEQTNFLIIDSVLSIEQDSKDHLNKPIREVREKLGMFAIADMCAEFTDEFEKEYKDEDWLEKEYIETVDRFVSIKLRRYET